MTHRTHTPFETIAQAIGYIERNFKAQPSLDEIAAHVGMSPFHFQRLFTAWAGTSPKKFLQYISLEHAKHMLAQEKTSVLAASVKIGLSGPSRLHDLFVSIEGMTPGEYKNGGAALALNYRFADSPFGGVVVASTEKGIAYLAFAENETTGFAQLQKKFPNARFVKKSDQMQKDALAFFSRDWSNLREIKLHLKGTDFQLNVWRALLTIPRGHLATYSCLATSIQHPKAHRAAGTAVGQNPVAFLIPCHRVIQASGVFGNYHWGPVRKTAMIGWEAALAEAETAS